MQAFAPNTLELAFSTVLSTLSTMQWNAQDIINWLLTKGTAQADLEALTQGLGSQFERADVPVSRMRIAIRTVHPLMTAFATTWERETGPIKTNISAHGLERQNDFAGSPMTIAVESKQTYRRNLLRLKPEDHSSLHDQHERGASDYFCIPLLFGNQIAGVLVIVSDKHGGLDKDEEASLHQIAHTLAPIIEVYRLTRLSTAVAETYLGQRTGHRVLGGAITRGHVDQIDAAILVSDLRGWTRLNTEKPVHAAVKIANQYFDIMDTAVRQNSGEF